MVGLSELREDMYDWSVQQGYHVWVAEKCSPVDADTPYSTVQDICLKEVRNANLFLWVLHQGYGDTATYDPSELSLLELEIFQAMLAHKPIVIFRLQPFQSEPRLESLLHILRISVPVGWRDFTSEARLKEHIKETIRDVSALSLKHPLRVIQRFVTALGCTRHTVGREGEFDRENRLLDNQSVERFLDARVDQTPIEQLIHHAQEADNYQDKLIAAWKAIRHLYAVPFHQDHHPEFCPSWNTPFPCGPARRPGVACMVTHLPDAWRQPTVCTICMNCSISMKGRPVPISGCSRPTEPSRANTTPSPSGWRHGDCGAPCSTPLWAI